MNSADADKLAYDWFRQINENTWTWTVPRTPEGEERLYADMRVSLEDLVPSPDSWLVHRPVAGAPVLLVLATDAVFLVDCASVEHSVTDDSAEPVVRVRECQIDPAMAGVTVTNAFSFGNGLHIRTSLWTVRVNARDEVVFKTQTYRGHDPSDTEQFARELCNRVGASIGLPDSSASPL